MPAGAAHGGRDEVAARESVTVALDHPEQFVPEHELVVVLGSHAEEPVRDLTVRPADADLEHADEHPAPRWARASRATRVEPLTPGRVTRACIPASSHAQRSRSTAPSDAEPTSSR